MRLHAQVWHKFRGAPFKKMVAICTAVEQVKQRRMPKRASDGDTDSRDPPEVIAIRRKARVSGRYRSTPDTQGGLAGPSSAFAGMAKPSFVFGAPSSGSGTSGGNTAVLPASNKSFAAGGFSFLNNAATTTPAAAPAAAPAPAPPQSQGNLPPQTSVRPLSSSAISQNTPSVTRGSVGTGRAFGEGRTAVQGGRLNKRFSSWIFHSLAEDASVFLDSGLRDYAAFAAEIRERADLAKIEPSPSTAFRHPSGSAAIASEHQSSPKAPKPVLSIAPPPSAAATTPPVEAPAASPPPVARPTSAFFPAASTLPAAPSSQPFSFAVPSASASSSASGTPSVLGAPSVIAPSVISPSTGFNFNAAGLGAVGAPPGVFKGFQVPSGVAIPPPGAAGSFAAGAEEDGMPKEDPSKLERAPGEENEEIVGQFRAKLFRFKKDEKAWGDMGVGMLRLMKHTTNDGRRLVLRNDMGKVILNAAVYGGMSVTKTKNAIKFMASVAGDGPTTFMVKVTKNEIDSLHSGVLGLVPS